MTVIVPANPVRHAFDMGGTATYAEREAVWVRTGDGEGLLAVTVRKTAGGKAETDLYAVEQQHVDDFRVREFLLVNLSDDDQPDAYAVTVTPKGIACTCKAGKVHRHECKHASAFSALISKGVL